MVAKDIPDAALVKLFKIPLVEMGGTKEYYGHVGRSRLRTEVARDVLARLAPNMAAALLLAVDSIVTTAEIECRCTDMANLGPEAVAEWRRRAVADRDRLLPRLAELGVSDAAVAECRDKAVEEYKRLVEVTEGFRDEFRGAAGAPN
jgi:hypothetical protein